MAVKINLLKSLLLFSIISTSSSCKEDMSAIQNLEKPHIIIIYTDDMGIGDLSCYNGGWTNTPNIDRLATEGIKFNHYYSASPLCSPSRASITTGIFPIEVGLNTYLHTRQSNLEREQMDYLDVDQPSMARVLKSVGYRTAHFGKWHMGGGRDVLDAPQIPEYGFDEYVSTYESPNPDPLLTSTDWIWSEGDSIKRWDRTAYFVDKTLDFLSRNQKDSPCFVNLWPDDMHTPWVPTSDYYGNKKQWTSKEAFTLVLKEFDHQIGRLMKGLEALGISDNTLVIFTSDNGPSPTFDQIRTNSAKGSKFSLYEGGINMPLIVRWPKKIEPGIIDNESVICSVDILPSLSAITDAKLPKQFDYSGQDMSMALLGAKSVQREKDLMWEYGRSKYHNKPEGPNQSPYLAIRRGNWKLLMNADKSDIQLFDLDKDRNETTNVVAMHPEIREELSGKLVQWYDVNRKKFLDGKKVFKD